MNPLLSHLQPYPFERLRLLFEGVKPNTALRPISLGIGEPKHPTPAFILDAMDAAGRAQPSGFAAYPAPDLPNPLLARADLLRELGSDDPARLAATLTRQGLVPDALTSPESLRLLLPALRADLELVLHHPHHPDAPLPLPITALGGVDDPSVTREQLAAWARHSARDFALRLLPGPHLFYRSHPRETLHALAQALACERTP